jgi:hypothetical protein
MPAAALVLPGIPKRLRIREIGILMYLGLPLTEVLLFATSGAVGEHRIALARVSFG